MRAHPFPRCPVRAGFTLIELLTVIAIVGILAAIIVPAVGRAQASARKSTCVSNLRQLGVAIHLFAQDNRDTLPSGTDYGVDVFNVKNGATGWWGWFSYLKAYTNPKGLLDERTTLACPDVADELPANYSSAHNATGYAWNRNLGRVTGGVLYPKRRAALESPAKTPMLWDSPFSTANIYDSTSLGFRHDDTAHLLMVDGHVTPILRQGAATQSAYPEFKWNG